jgi:hypothetical protein
MEEFETMLQASEDVPRPEAPAEQTGEAGSGQTET